MTGRPTHRQSRTPVYRIWNSMLGRCGNPSQRDYARYGGRGIKVCERWKCFEAFISDVGPRPSNENSIERKDNDGNYEPGNVCWATLIEQANNKRTNHLIEYRGKQMTIAEAVRAAGSLVLRETARNRISRGWSAEAAVETPNSFRRDPVTRKKITEGVAT